MDSLGTILEDCITFERIFVKKLTVLDGRGLGEKETFNEGVWP